MKTVLVLILLVACEKAGCQCYVDSDIAIHWPQPPGDSPFQEDSDQCLANFTIFSEDHIDDMASKGVNCSKRDSTATDGTWTYETDGTVINCDNNTGEVRCERGPGSVTLYTAFGCSGCGGQPYPNGIYTCCIEGSCISIRVYQHDDLRSLFPSIYDPVIESCSIIPPSDVTVIPQQYTVQMITSEVPPIRITPNIDCTNNCNGTTVGESYYKLIDLTDERYEYSVPVTWSADKNTTNLQYKCRVIFSTGTGGFFLNISSVTNITASSAPIISHYEVINATAIVIYWDITGNVNGFLINITSNGLSTVTQQLTNSSAREFIYNGVLPQRNYIIEIRGYTQLLGQTDTVNVRIEAGISSVEGTLLSVSNDLSTQHIEVNCYTFRVEPYQVTWRIDSELIKPDFTYLRMNGSELLYGVNQTYKQYISLEGSFSNGTIISCSTTVNGETEVEAKYVLQAASSPPTGLSVWIVSCLSLYVQWNSVSDANGYILQYTPNDETLLVNGSGSLSADTKGLTQGTTYHISVYSYKDLPSESSTGISVLYDVPLITLLNIQPLTPTSVMVSWDTSNSLVDNYTVSYTCLCDNIKGTLFIVNGASNSTVIDSLYPGLQYSISIIATNLLGKGIEKTDYVTLVENGPPTGAPLLQPPRVVSSTSVRLLWEELNCLERNGYINGYSIQYFIDKKPQPVFHTVPAIINTVLTGLAESSLYYIKIAAINKNGIGPYSQEFSFYTIDISISGLSFIASTRFVKLSWQPSMNLTNVSYTFEVAYITRPDNTECFGDLTTLPNGYTVYPVNTSSDNIEVFGLTPGTCYAFGVRVYTSISDSPGEFTVIKGATASEVVLNITLEDQQASSKTCARLSWTLLITQTEDSFTYEVGYIAQTSNTACTGTSLSTLPVGYTSFINTTGSSVVVTGLNSGTCYLFGVRVYSSRSSVPGEWTLMLQQSDTTGIDSVKCSCTGLIGGSVSGYVLSVILLVALVIQNVWILYHRKNDHSQGDVDDCNSKAHNYESTELTEGLYDVPDNEFEASPENIKMQACEVYNINKMKAKDDYVYI